jgi:hypothetical protein
MEINMEVPQKTTNKFQYIYLTTLRHISEGVLVNIQE